MNIKMLMPDPAAMKQAIPDFLNYCATLARVTARGWIRIGTSVISELVRIVAGLSFFQLAFYLACAAGFLIALFPWVHYEISFASKENADIGSESKLIFLLPSMAGLILATFEIPFKRWIYAAIVALALIFYLPGLIWPGFSHTSIQPSDFHMRFWVYLFGPVLIAQGALSVFALTGSAIRLAELRDRLFPHASTAQKSPSWPRKRATRSDRV